MTGTAESLANLITELDGVYASGQGGGAITAARVRQASEDFAVSVVSWDDGNNTSGLGAPAILRGTVSTYNLSGLTIGSGQTTGVRAANATALQNAITYCVNNGKFLEMPAGVYEISSSTGLVIPPTVNINSKSFTLRGEPNGTQVVQYYATSPGAPILTVGDPTNATGSFGYDISGLNLMYGAAQTGFTSSAGLVLGSTTGSVFEKINIGCYQNAPYNGVTMPSVFFSNTVRDIQVNWFQNYALYVLGSGNTGNSFDNIYLTNAGNPTQAVTAYIKAGANNTNHFARLNCEWGSCPTVIDLGNGVGFANSYTFSDLHLEGLVLTGSSPAIFILNDSAVLINSLELVNPIFTSLTGNPILMFDFGQSSIFKINGMFITAVNGNWTVPFFMFNQTLTDSSISIDIGGGIIIDDSNNEILGSNRLVFDSKMPAASFRAPQHWTRYTYGPAASKVERANIPVSATYTHYGQHEDAIIQVPASITSFTLTLANTMGATGGQAVRTGNTVRIRRMSGTASGTLTVAFGGTGTPATNTTSGADLWYVFDGTHWQTLTPVTS